MDEELEEGGYYEVPAGSLLIYDLNDFFEKTAALAVHVTEEGAVFVLDAASLTWRSFGVMAGAPKPPRALR